MFVKSSNVVPVPISKFTKPYALVVGANVSVYTAVPPADPCWIVSCIPTARLTKIAFPASLTTAWYLKPSGACPKVESAIAAIVKIDSSIFFIGFVLSCFNNIECL